MKGNEKIINQLNFLLADELTAMEANLLVEETHIDWIEVQLDQIKQMGIQNYFAQQKA
jgi:bacterioferritin (cytochrome b1)